MKKTISINISGVIFHIEEDGYDKLKSYLSSIQQYFSSYEDSQEIVTDIENRIAEKLLAKLKSADKQALSIDDVNELMASMGTVADFEAVEEEEVLVSSGYKATGAGQSTTNAASGAATGAYASTAGSTTRTTTGPRRLVRDLKRKTLGGVASGLANYFNVDPVWVRLLFVVLFFASAPIAQEAGASVSGFTLILYIAMWIALPGSMTLEDDKSVKKFYRNPDDKVLGGVAAGIAAYFGIDTGLVRLLFVLGIVFFGIGLIGYIVLWAISPTADTLTQKMEMQGQPITLSNIEHSIKSNLNVDDTAPESTLARILLFPFRLIATIVGGLGRALGPLFNGLVSVVRVFTGVIMLIVAGALMIACITVASFALGITSGGVHFGDSGVFEDMLRHDVSSATVLAGLATGFLPALGLAILGLMLISRRAMISSRAALTGLGVWVLSLIILGATVPPIVNGFRKSAHVEETTMVTPTGTPLLDLNRINADYENRPGLTLRGYEGTQLKLDREYQAQGRNRADAEANARTISYGFMHRDSVLRFDDGIELAKGARFRAQDLEMTLSIPYEKPFRMTRALAEFVRNDFSSKEFDRMDKSVWKFTRNDELVCLNFPREVDNDEGISNTFDEAGNDEVDVTTEGELKRQFDVGNFTDIDVSGAFAVRVVKGDSFKVMADGSDDDLDEMKVKTNGGVLTISMKNQLFNWHNHNKIGLTITLPTVRSLKLTGASTAHLTGFDRLNDLELELTGASSALLNGEVGKLSIDLTGASKAILKGRADNLEADLTGACNLKATEMTIDQAKIEASGASHADLGTVRVLESNTSGASHIDRQGGDTPDA